MVHAANVFDSDWRGVALWCCLHRVVFHPHVDLDAPILLYIRVFVFGIFDIAGDLRGDYGRTVLLSAVQ